MSGEKKPSRGREDQRRGDAWARSCYERRCKETIFEAVSSGQMSVEVVPPSYWEVDTDYDIPSFVQSVERLKASYRSLHRKAKREGVDMHLLSRRIMQSFTEALKGNPIYNESYQSLNKSDKKHAYLDYVVRYLSNLFTEGKK